MPRMTSTKLVISGLALSIIIPLTVQIVRARRGDLDSGSFTLVQAEAAYPKRVAMLVRRSDHHALSGNTYFVVIGDHVFSQPELRKALYRSELVFECGRDGLILHWENLNKLVIECRECKITPDIIQEQRFQVNNNIIIRYSGFP